MKKASDLLQSFFLKHGIEEGQQYVSFFKQWESIVGEDLAAHTDVEDIKNDALVVVVDHPAWMQILHMRKDEVVAKVNARFPDFGIAAIHMHLDTERTRRVKPRPTETAETKPNTEVTPTHATDDAEETTEHNPPVGSRLDSILSRLGRRIEEREAEKKSDT